MFSYLKSSEIIQSNITNEKEQSVYQIQANFEQVLQTVDLSVTNFVTSYQLTKTLDEPLIGKSIPTIQSNEEGNKLAPTI